jgi:hypothetical protein
MTRDALEHFQWLSQTNVQVVHAAFAVLQNTHESAVEDTRYEVGLECVDPFFSAFFHSDMISQTLTSYLIGLFT